MAKTITTQQEFDLSWTPVPVGAKLDSPPTAEVVEIPPLTSLEVAADGMSAVVLSGDATGVSTIRVSGVSMGVTVSSEFEVTINPRDVAATGFEFTAGDARNR